MKQFKLFAIGFIVLVLAACGSTGGPTDPGDPLPDPDPVPSEVIIPETTKVVDDATKQSLVEFDPTTGEMRFAQDTALLTELEPNDILVSDPSTAAGAGFLRKVSEIRRENGQVIVETEQAVLEEAIEQGSLSVEQVLTDSDIASSVALLEGIAFYNPSLSSQDLATQAFGFGISFDEVLYDADGNENTTDDQLVLDGSFEFTPKVLFDVDFKFLKLQKVKIGMGFEERASIGISGFAGVGIDKKLTVAQKTFSPITFWIGPVPVVLVPQVDVVIGLNGQVGAEFSFGVEQSIDVTIAGQWKRGQGWENLSGVDRNVDWNGPDFSLSLTARAYAGAEAEILLYGIAGPYLYGYAFAELDIEIPRDPLWIAYAGLEAGVGFKIEILGKSIADWNKKVLEVKAEFARAANSKPSITITAPSSTNIDVDSRVSFEAEASDPEDGDCFFNNKCSITWTSSKDGALGSSDYTEFTFTDPGVRTVTATVTDSKGESSSDSITINVINTPPTPFITVPTTVRAGQQQNIFTGGATDKNLGPIDVLDCDGLVWSVDGNGQINGSNVGCQVDIRFNSQGSSTVTLTSTDPQGASASTSRTVTVQQACANQPPVINLNLSGVYDVMADDYVKPGQNIALWTPLELRAVANDPEGQALSYSWIASVDGGLPVQIGNSATLDWQIPNDFDDNGGDINIALIVSDGTCGTEIQYSFKFYTPAG